MKEFTVAIVGAGIVGLATAYALTRRGCSSVVIVEAEDRVAAHQTGHNSGVIHAGLYYKPGSLKAKNCAIGRELMYDFCREHGIRHERCGKLVVATEERELPALEELHRRGTANGLRSLRKLNADELKEYEPHVRGIAGLHVAETGIVDYKAVAQQYARLAQERGAALQTYSRLIGVRPQQNQLVLTTTSGEFVCRYLINCGGLQSDRVARLCGVDPGLQIIPFRGEYYQLTPERQFLVKNLIYPVPDPRFPFLGVHFTRTVSGGIEAGPNAVLALRREGYRWRDVSLRDTWEMLTYRGFWKMAFRYARTGIEEVYRSLSKRAFWKALQRLVPELRKEDIERAGSGVRAQAVEPDGKLVDDFRIIETERMIHVLNAPSPAATASLSIGQTISERAIKQFQLE